MWNIESSDDIPVVLEHRKNIGLRIVQVCIKHLLHWAILQGSILSLVNNIHYRNLGKFYGRSFNFKSRLSLIVRVNIVLTRTMVLLTVTDVSTTCAVVIFRVKVSCITSVDGIVLWLLI